LFPKLEGTDQNAAYMTLGMTVEDLVFKKGDGKNFDPPGAGFKHAEGVDRLQLPVPASTASTMPASACRRSTRSRSSRTFSSTTRDRSASRSSARARSTSRRFRSYVPETDVQPFLDHFAKRGVKGEVPARLTGMIQTYDNDKRDLFTLNFQGADILNVQPTSSTRRPTASTA